jgi:hypothetical protein
MPIPAVGDISEHGGRTLVAISLGLPRVGQVASA